MHQGERGLQVESWLAIPFLWSIVGGSTEHTIAYDNLILTFEIDGPGVEEVLAIATPLMAGAVGAFILLGALAVRAGGKLAEVLPPLAIGLTVTLIITNKVGSPQFVTWLAPAVILALVWSWKRYWVYGALALLVGGLTHIIYPYLYGWFLATTPWMVVVATIRAGAELAMVVLAAGQLVRLLIELRKSKHLEGSTRD